MEGHHNAIQSWNFQTYSVKIPHAIIDWVCLEIPKLCIVGYSLPSPVNRLLDIKFERNVTNLNDLKSNINYKQKRGIPVQSSHNYSTFTKHHITSHFRSESSDAYWKSLENKYYIFFDYGILAYTGPIRYHNINIINIISSHWYESCGVWRFFLAHWESSTPVLSMVTKFVTGKHCITLEAY